MFVALASACNETRAGTNGCIEKGRGRKKRRKKREKKIEEGRGKNRTRGGTKKKDRIREEKGRNYDEYEEGGRREKNRRRQGLGG